MPVNSRESNSDRRAGRGQPKRLSRPLSIPEHALHLSFRISDFQFVAVWFTARGTRPMEFEF
jgi:hypothetical protein